MSQQEVEWCTGNVYEALKSGVLQEFKTCGVIMYHCQVCNVHMTGIEPAKAHLKGSQHSKRLHAGATSFQLQVDKTIEFSPHSLTNGNNFLGETSTVKSSPVTSRGFLAEVDGLSRSFAAFNTMDQQMKCDVCGVKMDGIIPYKQHLNGEPHRKKLKMSGVASKIHSPVFPLQASPNVSLDSEQIWCHICDIFVTGNVPYQQHLDGEKHKKKFRSGGNNATGNLTSFSRPEFSSNLVVTPKFSPAIYPAVMSGDQLQKAKTEGDVIDIGNGHMQCLVCDITCSCADNMLAHLNGGPHAKKKRQGGSMVPVTMPNLPDVVVSDISEERFKCTVVLADEPASNMFDD